jgi:hypothetical protein
LFDWQIGRPRTLQNPVDEDRAAPPDLIEIRAVADQPTSLDKQSQRIHGRQPAPRSQLRDPPGRPDEEPAAGDEESTRVRVIRACDGSLYQGLGISSSSLVAMSLTSGHEAVKRDLPELRARR